MQSLLASRKHVFILVLSFPRNSGEVLLPFLQQPCVTAGPMAHLFDSLELCAIRSCSLANGGVPFLFGAQLVGGLRSLRRPSDALVQGGPESDQRDHHQTPRWGISVAWIAQGSAIQIRPFRQGSIYVLTPWPRNRSSEGTWALCVHFFRRTREVCERFEQSRNTWQIRACCLLRVFESKVSCPKPTFLF